MATAGFFAALQRRYFWYSYCIRKPKGAGCSWIVLGWAILIIFFGLTTGIVGQKRFRQDTKLENDHEIEEKICRRSVDIRNTIGQFDVLRGCSVVEGSVQILLFDSVNESLFSNITFPELREITDYLMLYRVNGLRSIGHLFPNLAVIRGQKTFFGYSFVVFEMSSLQEIGLYSLTDITHGLIRIDKNPSLCFVNSIDWELIAYEKGDHSIESIKPDNECPICPGDDKDEEGSHLNISACPRVMRKLGVTEGRHLCWNRQHCQKVCPSHCHSCNDKGECCDSKCLGGCSNGACDVCRNFTVEVGRKRQCRDQCPSNLYEYLGRRCIKEEECKSLKRPMDLHGRIQYQYPYKIYRSACVLNCPPNYMDDHDNYRCVPCEGRCKKECPSTNVDSLASAQQLRGCTHIKGSLEIQIRGGRHIVNELEENLNMIEEIDGYLKIVRSFPLVSLNFLKSLKVIHGNNLDSQKYVFVVLDNQNLQDLWNWENRTLKIGNGKLFFHFNPKLCYSKIETLRLKANLGEFSELEVAPNSNGDKIACNVANMSVSVKIISSRAVILEWLPFHMDDHRKLLGYVVYSIEAPYRNITLYDGRDACGGDGWRVDDVGNQEDNNSPLHHLLAQLKPYTQYAFYVKTYTIATERNGAQSSIYYFRTHPDVPSKPLNLQIRTNSSSSLYITWQPPLNPHGNVTYYIVSGQQHRDMNNEELLNNRNYCHDPPTPSKQTMLLPPLTITTPKSNKNDTCQCDEDMKPGGPKIKEEKDIISQINFENELHNQVYIKKDVASSERRKREIIGYEDQNLNFPTNIDEPINSVNNSIQNVTENGTDIWVSFNFPVYGKTELYLTKLHHFTVYNLHVQACREKEGSFDKKESCSDISIVTARTQKKAGADNVTNVHVTNQSLNMVTLAWKEPVNPNGLILTYQIEYKRMDVENLKPTLECITRKQFLNQKMMYTLNKLSPGNYSLRLVAISQAGNGDYSSYINFLIEETSNISSVQIFLYVFAAVAVALVMGFLGLYIFRRIFGPPVPSIKLIASVNPEYVSTVYIPDDWEVSRKKIDLIKELGQGSFGMVYEGLARDISGIPEMKCAVKTVNEHATNRERIEFLNEASVMKAFDTAHVVRLLGVVSQGQPTLVVMELMANGDLKSYLRSHRPDADSYTGRQPPTLKRILQMAIEIADGMAYLAAKKFVHRDLAARNCMVAEDLTVKIGDFGMTRDIYETDYYRKGTKGLLPVRWMAPESLKDGVFTSSSDVWSYGVVLWEMATLASQPYQGLSNDQVLRYVIDGGVMECPENCPDKLYSLMRYCWQHKPVARPTFLEMAGQLVDDASPTFTQISFYHSAAGIEARNSYTATMLSQDDPATPLKMVRDLDEDFSLGSSEGESELEIGTDTRIDFPAFPTSKDGSIAANGYVSGHPTNGTATTTQC